MTKKRMKELGFHVEINDFFGTLATVLDLSRQTLGNTAREREVAYYLAKNVDDLMYLQHHFRIVRVK